MNGSPSGPRIVWRKQFATGVAAVDHEHRELIALVDRVLDLLDAGGDKDAVESDLGEVYARISAHFALEEQIMREKRYDQLDDHKTDHERLLDDIRDIMEAFVLDTYRERREEFAERLQNWFSEHFRTKDARLHKMLRQ
jgi:hemerythrin-like metal-binding protein